MEMQAVLMNGSFHGSLHGCLLSLMSKHFASLPAFFDEMVEGDEWTKSMVGGSEREKEKNKNKKAQERYYGRARKRNKRKAVDVKTLTGQ